MLPKFKGSMRNVIIIAGKHRTRRYRFSKTFSVDPDEALVNTAKRVGKGAAHAATKGYEKISDSLQDLYHSYRVRRMMKKAKRGVSHLRAAVHI